MGVLRALRIAPPSPPPQRSENPSYALKELASDFDIGAEYRKYCHVLDLGASVRENFEFYSKFAAHIQIEELASNLFDANGKPAPDPLGALPGNTAQFCQDKGLDLIVCWDLFNYCTLNQAAELGQILGRHSKPGTRLFTLIGTHSHITARPSLFRITDGLRLVYERTTSEMIKCPKWTKTEVNRFLPGFTRVRSFLLRNGMEEQLFVFE